MPTSTRAARGPLEKLYTDLTAAPMLDPEMQRRIFTYAERARRTALLTKLAHTPDIAPDVDTRLREHPSTAVKAAWASRPGRPMEDLLRTIADHGGRGPLARVIAETPGLPATAYQAAAAATKTLVAHAALLANPSVPWETKRVSARVVIATIKDGAHSDRTIERYFAAHPDLLLDSLEHTSCVGAYTWAARKFNLTAEQLDRMHTLARELLTGPNATSWWASGDVLMAATQAITQPEAATGFRRVDWSTLGDSSIGSRHRASPSVTEFVVARAGGARRRTPPGQDDVRTAAAATTPEELLAATTGLHNGERPDLLLAILRNPHLNVDVLDRLGNEVRRLGYRRLGDLGSQRSDNVDVLAMLYLHHHTIPPDAYLARTGDPVGALRTAVAHHLRLGRPVPSQIAKSAYVTRDIVAALPLESISKHGTLHAKLIAAELIDEALAHDGVWEMFETLSVTFRGDLASLLAACGFIMAPHAA